MKRRTALGLLASPLFAQSGAPAGKLTKHEFRDSKNFPGTVRDYWVYVPAQYDGAQPAALMVFQDGAGYVNEKGPWKVPAAFDALIAKGEMPVTVGVFVTPGVLPALSEGQQNRYNRSYEYDSLGDRYARFLLEELLPEVEKSVKLTADPNLRGIAGASSGAICAMNVAWHRPDAFRRVFSTIGTYVNIRGAHVFPTLIRKTEPKPLRVFLEDGDQDLNIYAGNWWLANQEMASAFEFAGYDYKFETGHDGHNSNHGSAIFADAMRWLWRDWKTPIAKPTKVSDRQWSQMIVEPGSEWELVSEGHKFTEGPAVDKNGDLFFTDIPNNRVHKVDAGGRRTVFREDTGGANGLMFGPDGRLYACQNSRRRVVAWSMDGAESVIAEGMGSNDIAVTSKGEVYFTDPRDKRVWFVDRSGAKRVVHEGINFPNGVVLSPDQGLLYVCDYWGRFVWSFQVQPNGDLAHGQPFGKLEIPDETDRSSADGMTVDTEGHVYVTTAWGVQVLDQPGRVVAILNKPQNSALANCVFAGPDLKTLYVTAGDKVFKRRMRRQGVVSWAPVKPPVPRL